MEKSEIENFYTEPARGSESKNQMNPIEIRVGLLRAGITQAEIARSMDPPVSKSAVTRVIYGTSISRRIREAIAVSLGLSTQDIWPSTSKESGSYKTTSQDPKTVTCKPVTHLSQSRFD